MYKVLLIGSGGREHAIAAALVKNGNAQVYVAMNEANPGLLRLASAHIRTESNAKDIVAFCQQHSIDFCFCGPEKPQSDGVTDALNAAGVPCASPSQAAAQIETSKIFMRQLLDKYNVQGQIRYCQTSHAEEAIQFAQQLGWRVAVKPVGLTGGKGVKVWGDHLHSEADVRAEITDVLQQGISGHHQVVVEECLVGQEFTLHFYCDGRTALPSPLIQDHKRAYDGDRGPNTGGMGAYSCENGLLPFITQNDYDAAAQIGQQVITAMAQNGTPFRGVLYGQFMQTASGPRIIEFNSRFGDPEAINALAVLESDFAEVCRAIIDQRLHEIQLTFRPVATMLVYVVPPGYGTDPVAGTPIVVNEAAVRQAGAQVFYASCNLQGRAENPGGDKVTITTTRSRTLGLFAEGRDLEQARTRALAAVNALQGHFAYRSDMGAPDVMAAKLAQMQKLKGAKAA